MNSNQEQRKTAYIPKGTLVCIRTKTVHCTVPAFRSRAPSELHKETKQSSEFGKEDLAALVPDLNLIQHLWQEFCDPGLTNAHTAEWQILMNAFSEGRRLLKVWGDI